MHRNQWKNRIQLSNLLKQKLTHPMDFLCLLSRQGKVRLVQWYSMVEQREKQKIIPDVISLVLNRKPKLANIIEYKEYKIVFKKYASLYFVVGTSDPECNELLLMEEIHRFVEVLDRYFGNVILQYLM